MPFEAFLLKLKQGKQDQVYSILDLLPLEIQTVLTLPFSTGYVKFDILFSGL